MKTLITPYVDTSVNAVWDEWQSYPNGRPNPIYSEDAIEWKTDGLILAFITLSPGKKPCWAGNDAMPLDWSLPLANELNAAGLKCIISFGGASNPDISTYFGVDELEDIYLNTIDMYQAQGLDFDLENALFDENKIFKALASLQLKRPNVKISLTLPVMPTGLTSTGLNIITKAESSGIIFSVNGMAMDYGNPQDDADMGTSAIKAAKSIMSQLGKLYPTLQETQLYAKTAITPMIGLNDDLAMFKLEDAVSLAEFARESTMAFLGFWSFNRDNPSKYNYVDLTTSSNPEQTYSGEYTETFVSNINE